jgi:hypothetical protein
MATTVPSAFTAFAEALKPTATEEDQLTTRRRAVEDFLRSTYPADSRMPLIHVKTIGSAGRKTLIRPVDDLDVFAVFDDNQVWASYRHDSKQLLYRVREALTGYRVETVGSRGQAVRLFYTGGPHVDITPAFRVFNMFGQQDGYYIPSGDGTWTQTNPYVHHDFMADRNQVLNGHLKPLVRALKAWNNSHSKRLSSFHLEVLTQGVFGTMSASLRKNTQFFFEHANTYIDVSDPAGYSGNLAGSWSWQKRQDVQQAFANAYSRATNALNAEAAGDPAEAVRQWRILFGSQFPTYG